MAEGSKPCAASLTADSMHERTGAQSSAPAHGRTYRKSRSGKDRALVPASGRDLHNGSDTACLNREVRDVDRTVVGHDDAAWSHETGVSGDESCLCSVRRHTNERAGST